MAKNTHPSFKLYRNCLVMLAIVFGNKAHGQESQLWLTYFNQKALSPKWDILTDINHRRTGYFTRYNSTQAIRIGLNYNMHGRHTIAAGYAWFLSNAGSSIQKGLHENRLWQQWRWRLPVGKASYVHRVRLEQRWRQIKTDNGNGPPANDFSLRYRYYTHWQQSFTAKSPFSWIGATEIMLQSGANIKNTMNQWRLLAGLVYKSGVPTEWLLAYQFIQLPDSRISMDAGIHTIRITCSQLFAHRQPQAK
jgi:Protein of unknown function (DUF2490)